MNQPDPGAMQAQQGASTDLFARFMLRHTLFVRVSAYLVVAVAVVVGVILWLRGELNAEDAGYAGAFLINLVGSGAIFLPVPGVLAVCVNAYPEFELNPLWLGLLGGVGAGLGEVTGYLLGFGGQGALSRLRFYPRIHGWVRRRGGIALFLLALVPNPVFDLGGVAAGALGYPLPKFMAYVAAGKVLRYLGIAYGCHLGSKPLVDWIQRIF